MGVAEVCHSIIPTDHLLDMATRGATSCTRKLTTGYTGICLDVLSWVCYLSLRVLINLTTHPDGPQISLGDCGTGCGAVAGCQSGAAFSKARYDSASDFFWCNNKKSNYHDGCKPIRQHTKRCYEKSCTFPDSGEQRL